MKTKTIYLSGPQHLKTDGKAFYQNAKELCKQYHFELVKPPAELFNPISTQEEGNQLAQKRLQQIKEADIIIADVNDYKNSVEPYNETGLVFGIAWSLHKPFYGYMDSKAGCALRWKYSKHKNEEGRWVDDDFNAIFEGGCLNLMLESDGHIIEGKLEDVLKEISKEGQ